MTVVLFHSKDCDLDPFCDGECLYTPERPTDQELERQWTAALDYAERMGAQTAQMLSAVDTAWQVHTRITQTWKAFLAQFDVETWHLLKDAFREGFDSVHYRLLAARGLR